VIVAAEDRWQSGVTTLYRCGTEKDGVQWSEELTVTVRMTRIAQGTRPLGPRAH
jgi:hypothetical protein